MDDPYCYCGTRVEPPLWKYCSHRCQELSAKAGAYGMDGASFEELPRQQGGACALCFRSFRPGGFAPVIDHDHQTGAVRGLLCQRCNLRIGFYERGNNVNPRDSTLEDFADRASLYLARGHDPASPRRSPSRNY